MPPLTTDRATAQLPHIRRALFDSAEREYLLDTPPPPPMFRDSLVYPPRVHAAHVPAFQGYDAEWLARSAELPRDATRRIDSPAATARASAIDARMP